MDAREESLRRAQNTLDAIQAAREQQMLRNRTRAETPQFSASSNRATNRGGQRGRGRSGRLYRGGYSRRGNHLTDYHTYHPGQGFYPARNHGRPPTRGRGSPYSIDHAPIPDQGVDMFPNEAGVQYSYLGTTWPHGSGYPERISDVHYRSLDARFPDELQPFLSPLEFVDLESPINPDGSLNPSVFTLGEQSPESADVILPARPNSTLPRVRFADRTESRLPTPPVSRPTVLRYPVSRPRDLAADRNSSQSVSYLRTIGAPPDRSSSNQQTCLAAQGPTTAVNGDLSTGIDNNSPLAYIYHSLASPAINGILGSTLIEIREPISTTLNSFFGSMYLSSLENLVLPKSQLEDNGYWTRDLTDQELLDKRRCQGCNRFWGRVRKAQEYALRTAVKEEQNKKLQKTITAQQASSTSTASSEPRKLQSVNAEHKSPSTPINVKASATSNMNTKDDGDQQARLICKFHTGSTVRQYEKQNHVNQRPMYKYVWSCCGKPPAGEPCSGAEQHQIFEEDIQHLAREWSMIPTPSNNPVNSDTVRAAVAIDCEMGTSKTGDSELIRVTLVDYFTSEKLIDNLVWPAVPMQDLRTRFSGVSWTMLNAALARKECILGREAARQQVWQFVGPHTIVVAHSGYNDLAALRWRHERIIDTFLIEDLQDRVRRRLEREANKAKEEEDARSAVNEPKKTETDESKTNSNEAVDASHASSKKESNGDNIPQPNEAAQKPKKVKGSGPFSLKTLTRTRLGREIQDDKKGHDSLEDALAARDLAHWLVRRNLERNPE